MMEFNPYLAPSSVVADPIGHEPLELAERGTRLGAKLLDALFVIGALMVVGILAAIFIPLMGPRHPGEGYKGGGGEVWLFVVLAILAGAGTLAVVVWNLIWLHRYGQTIAKRLLRIRIVRSNGDPVHLGRLVGLRIILISVIEQIPLLGAIFTLVNICFIFREDRRCLHDLIADTMVIKVSV